MGAARESAGAASRAAGSLAADAVAAQAIRDGSFPGTVVKLDRGFPLVRLADGREVRCEHATGLVKGADLRAVIGDAVAVELPEAHDKGVIAGILPRRTQFVRRDPAERTAKQVLAANFDLVIIAEPIVGLNRKRLERELVLAHDTGADVAVILTKADLADADDTAVDDVRGMTGRSVRVLATSTADAASVERARSLVGPGEVAILIGKSGVGKSSLVNALAGREVQGTAEVRKRDGKGRHTTVDRVMVELPGGGFVVDMPGVRGLGMWEADQGLGAAFPDIEELAASCRFRDCAHGTEPGCAVQAAVAAGDLAAVRVESYRSLAAEIARVRKR